MHINFLFYNGISFFLEYFLKKIMICFFQKFLNIKNFFKLIYFFIKKHKIKSFPHYFYYLLFVFKHFYDEILVNRYGRRVFIYEDFK